MRLYWYQPLQHNNPIRVLVLRPSAIDTRPVECTIKHVRLSDASLEYEAAPILGGTRLVKR